MKRIRSVAWALLALLIAVGITSAFRSAFAQRPKVTKQEDHYSPVLAEVTMPEGKVRQMMVTGAAYGFQPASLYPTNTNEYSHVFVGYSEAGAVKVWLDTIAEIKDTLNAEATIVLKDGTERTLGYGNASDQGNNVLLIARTDGGTESIRLPSVKKVRFLKPARKDKRGNAMFDHWQYSPYTGEKLAED